MEIGSLSLILIVGLLILISIGVPMGFASGFMGAVLVFLYIGEHALGILLSRYYSLVVTYSFLSVPLFIFMASLLERSNIARDLYDALNAWLRKTRGGVGVVTAIMATIMAAMSGIIGGEIVLLGLIALPQMLRLKYDQDMSIGIICASGFMGAVLVFLYIGEHALGILLSRYYSLVVTYSFLSVPLFIFMASLLERSNIARDLYDALNAWLRKTRGGVGVVTAIMATIMACL